MERCGQEETNEKSTSASTWAYTLMGWEMVTTPDADDEGTVGTAALILIRSVWGGGVCSLLSPNAHNPHYL
jgi:hypothetical protein